METDRDRRAMPLGHKDREMHEAGAQDHGELMNYEQNNSRTMSDDNLKMFQVVEMTIFKVGEVTMFCRRFIYSLINFEDEMEQRKQYEHLFFLGHTQVLLGQSDSRRPTLAFEGDDSRSRLRPGDDQGKKDTQKERKNKLRKTHYRIGEASNPGPETPINASKQTKLGNCFHHIHTQKDDKDMWCKEKGYSIENIAGDGNCLYTCLGKVGNYQEKRSERLFAIMQKEYGARSCTMTQMDLS